jgi:hypothetical protein
MANRTETGKDGTLISNGRTVPFSTVSIDLSFDTAEVDANDRLNNEQAYVSKSAELTIEADGSKEELRDQLMSTGQGQTEAIPEEGLRATVKGSEQKDHRFEEGRVTSFGREFPADDLTTTEVELTFDKHRIFDTGE